MRYYKKINISNSIIKMVTLKKVTKEEVYETIHSYITNKEDSVNTYEDMVNIILSMIKEGYCFIMDRDCLRDAMESLTYMYSPEDDMNRDRLIVQFDDEDDDEDDDGDESGDDELDMLKMMQMMGMAPPNREVDMNKTNPDPESVVEVDSANDSTPDTVTESDSASEIKTCEVTNNKCEEGCETSCKKVE